MNSQTETTEVASGPKRQPVMPDLPVCEGLEPLFTSAPRTGVLSAWYGHVPFAYWITAALRPRCFVELGTHYGVSYAAFCDAASRGGADTRCFAVDTWQGDEHAGYYGEEVYQDFRAYHDARFAAFSELIRSTFDQAHGYFEDGSIDLLHIDGCHSYAAVRHDFDKWHQKLSPRGVVLLHDTNVRERDFGVWRLWAELRRRYPSFEFLHEHGLGVLAVGTEVPGRVHRLCCLSDESDIASIRNRFSLSGRCCILEAEVCQLRRDAAAGEKAWAKGEHLVGQLDDALLLAQTLAHARDAAQTALKVAAEERDAAQQAHLQTQKELTRVSTVAKTQEQTAARWRVVMHSQSIKLQNILTQEQTEKEQLIVLAASLREEISRLDQHRRAIERSTAWQMTWPARVIANRVPKALRSASRRVLTAAWRVVTSPRISARSGAPHDPLSLALCTARGGPPGNVVAGAVAPDPTGQPSGPPGRHSLACIPSLPADYSAALDWYDPAEPEVSIVIPNWNRSDMTLLCLQHLWQRTTGRRYEVIVIDNGSDRKDREFLLDNAPLARIIPVGVNRYFGEANNIGVEAARGHYICLLNNDAFVHDGWLVPLIRPLEANPKAGAVGPRFLYPSGVLQEAGALVNADGSVVQLGKGGNADDPLFASMRQVDYVSAACVAMRREVFLQALGFDLAWDPVYYEDIDLCLKLRLLGLRTFCCPESTVTHIENATTRDPSNGLQFDSIISMNRTKFADRWGAFLGTRGAEKPNLVLLCPPASVAALAGKPRVAIFTPHNITLGGGERYIFTIAEALQEIANVVLLTPGRFSRTRIMTLGRELGLQLSHIDPVCLSDAYQQPPFDLAFVLGDEILPPIGRLATRNVYICQAPFPTQDEANMRGERAFWNEYDLVLTYSSFVYGHVSRIVGSLGLPERPIEVLSPPVPLLPVGRGKRAQILHVGEFVAGRRSKRQDVLIDAFRKLRKAGVNAELHLAGSVDPGVEHRAYYAGLVESAADLGVCFHANCSTAVLQRLYAGSRIYWQATGFGCDEEPEPHIAAPFSISMIEAMSAGCIPIVYSAGGPAETVEDEVTGFYFRSIDELCARTRDLLEETPRAQLDVLANAAANASRPYDEAAFKTAVRLLATRFITI